MLDLPPPNSGGQWQIKVRGFPTKNVLIPVVIGIPGWGVDPKKAWQDKFYIFVDVFLSSWKSNVFLLGGLWFKKYHWNHQLRCLFNFSVEHQKDTNFSGVFFFKNLRQTKIPETETGKMLQGGGPEPIVIDAEILGPLYMAENQRLSLGL